MTRIMRGWLGARHWGGGILLALVVTGCGSSSDDSGAKKCGTILDPGQFKVTNVSPAKGSTVPNSGIVQSFTIEGELIELKPLNFSEVAAAHTAGDASPSPLSWTLTPSASGKDSVYTSEPVTWGTAPGHVELSVGGVFHNDTTTCVSEFSGAVFSYDVTAP